MGPNIEINNDFRPLNDESGLLPVTGDKKREKTQYLLGDCMSAHSCTQSDYAKLMKARRMATRRRAEAACLPCKARKVRCSDFRPCARCASSGRADCETEATIQPTYPVSTVIGAMSSSQGIYEGFSSSSSSQGFYKDFSSSISTTADDERQLPTQIVAPVHDPAVSSRMTTTRCACSAPENFLGRWEWAWEAAAGPGEDDPFQDDFTRSQQIWGKGGAAVQLHPVAASAQKGAVGAAWLE